MAKTYAWSRFILERNEWGQQVKYAEPGDELDQKSLKVDDDEWQALLDSGAVRETPYPEDVPDGVSPQEHVKAQVASGEMTFDEGNKALGAYTEPESEPTPKTTAIKK
jgi:hypothetical protein